MSSEFEQKPVWSNVGPYRVSSEVFLDVIFTSACDCVCPWCIARTPEYAREDRKAFEQALRDAFRLFRIRDVIVLGGEATLDKHFWEKLELLSALIREHPVDRLILTTNGNRLRDAGFIDRLAASRVDSVNLSRMHYDQAINDEIFGASTLTKEEVARLYAALKSSGKTLRINVNVYRDNIDSVSEMNEFVRRFGSVCDAVKFTPLMCSDMFGTVKEVTCFCRKHALSEESIARLFDDFASAHRLIETADRALGFVKYAHLEAFGHEVILKYAQVEDKYDLSSEIPTLKLYPNGCLSNEWSYTKDIRDLLCK